VQGERAAGRHTAGLCRLLRDSSAYRRIVRLTCGCGVDRFNRREIKEMADADMSRKGHQMREKGRVAMVQVCEP